MNDVTYTQSRLFNNNTDRHAKIVAALENNKLLSGVYPHLEVVGGKGIRVCIGTSVVAYVVEDLVHIHRDSPLDADGIDAMLNEVYYGRPAIAPVSKSVITGLFNELWNKFEKKGYRRGYDASWANGTGYFNVTQMPDDGDHDTFSFIDDKGRKAMVLWDSLSGSRIVVFQRYSENGLVAYNHTFGCRAGVSGAGAVHLTPYIIGRMMEINTYASLND